jgi:hypothetical protein
MSDFANLDPLLVADEFNVGRLIPALANIVTAVRGAGLGDLAQEILSATQTCGIGIFPAEEWIEGQDKNEPTGQVGRLGFTPTIRPPAIVTQHQSRANVHNVTLGNGHPNEKLQDCIHFLYLLLSSAARERFRLAGYLHEHSDESRGRFGAIFAAYEKFTTSGEDVRLFVHMRVLINDEIQAGGPDRLVYWQVRIVPSKDANPRLECVGNAGLIWKSQSWQDLFFHGDWNIVSEAKGERYLIV